MAESPSSALPGGVEWLPALGGARLLRAHAGSGESPALILDTAPDGEHRIEARPGARFSPYAEYLVPAGLKWASAWLQWSDGTRATVPTPKTSRAEIIELRPRRAPGTDTSDRSHPLASRPAAGWSPLIESHDAATPSGGSPPDGATGDASPSTPGATPPPSAALDGATGDASPQPAAPSDDSPAVAAAGTRARADTAVPTDDPELSWTAPPQVSGPTGAAAEAQWRSRRAELERELSRAAESLARAREGERATRDSVLEALAGARADLRAVRAARAADASALATLAGELDAERSAHAVSRGSIGTLAQALSAARAELAAVRAAADADRETGADARAHLASARRDAALARAQLEGVRADLEAERAHAEATLSEARDGATLEQRIAELDRRAAGLRDQAELERRAREHTQSAAAATRPRPEQTGRLLADLDAAAAALRATAPAPDDPPPADAEPPEQATAPAPDDPSPEEAEPAPAATVDAPLASEPPAAEPPAAQQVAEPPAIEPPVATSVALVATSDEPRLRRALVALAREDAVAAGQLLVGLLPAQGAVLEGPLSYDLTVRGVGTYSVSVSGGSARVQRRSRKRSRGEALFHLAGDPLVLAELLAGEQRRLGRFARGARVTGRSRRVRALAGLPAARLSLAVALRAGARLEPSLVYRALPFAVAPEWTKGHAFTVAQEIVELAPRAWYVTARDGAALRVVEHASAAAADATVTMTRATFDRLLRGEPAPVGERPTIRGDRAAVAALRRWTELARGG